MHGYLTSDITIYYLWILLHSHVSITIIFWSDVNINIMFHYYTENILFYFYIFEQIKFKELKILRDTIKIDDL